MITHIDVLFDDECGLCRRCARWLAEEPCYVPLRPVGRRSDRARLLYGPLLPRIGEDEIAAVSSDGRVYRAADAYLICLWATRRWRSLSLRLARPTLKPLVRAACLTLAKSRRSLSALFALSDDRLAAQLRQADPPRCENESTADRAARLLSRGARR